MSHLRVPEEKTGGLIYAYAQQLLLFRLSQITKTNFGILFEGYSGLC